MYKTKKAGSRKCRACRLYTFSVKGICALCVQMGKPVPKKIYGRHPNNTYVAPKKFSQEFEDKVTKMVDNVRLEKKLKMTQACRDVAMTLGLTYNNVWYLYYIRKQRKETNS